MTENHQRYGQNYIEYCRERQAKETNPLARESMETVIYAAMTADKLVEFAMSHGAHNPALDEAIEVMLAKPHSARMVVSHLILWLSVAEEDHARAARLAAAMRAADPEGMKEFEATVMEHEPAG